MTRTKNEIKRIEKRLFAAHRQRPELRLSPQWQRHLMQEVTLRRSTVKPMQMINGFTAAFTTLLFRFAGASTPVAVALLVLAYLYGDKLDAHIASLMIDYPVDVLPIKRLFWY